MNYEEYMELGLNGDAPLKVIMCGSVESVGSDKVGVVAVVYATFDKKLAEKRIQELIAEKPQNYYMVYSVPLDVDLTALAHYPSIEIANEDLR